MISDIVKLFTSLGSTLALSQIVQSPAMTFVVQSAILLTCAVVMAHHLIKCRRENSRWQQLKKREAERGRSDAANTR